MLDKRKMPTKMNLSVQEKPLSFLYRLQYFGSKTEAVSAHRKNSYQTQKCSTEKPQASLSLTDRFLFYIKH